MKLLKIEYANIIRVNTIQALNENPDIEIRPITLDNLEDGLSFNTKKDLEFFKKFLQIGHKGYYAYYKGECGLRTWIFNTEERCIVGENFVYGLLKNEVFSGWSKTGEKFRKKGLFTTSLKYAILDNKDKVVSAYVASDNIGSLKGTEKAGFITLEKYTLITLWKFHIKIRTYQYKKNGKFFISFGRKIKAVMHEKI